MVKNTVIYRQTALPISVKFVKEHFLKTYLSSKKFDDAGTNPVDAG